MLSGCSTSRACCGSILRSTRLRVCRSRSRAGDQRQRGARFRLHLGQRLRPGPGASVRGDRRGARSDGGDANAPKGSSRRKTGCGSPTIATGRSRASTLQRTRSPSRSRSARKAAAGRKASSKPEAMCGRDPEHGSLAGVDPDEDAPIGEISLSYPSGPCGAMSTFGSRIYIGGCPGEKGMEVMDFKRLESAAGWRWTGRRRRRS